MTFFGSNDIRPASSNHASLPSILPWRNLRRAQHSSWRFPSCHHRSRYSPNVLGTPKSRLVSSPARKLWTISDMGFWPLKMKMAPNFLPPILPLGRTKHHGSTPRSTNGPIRRNPSIRSQGCLEWLEAKILTRNNRRCGLSGGSRSPYIYQILYEKICLYLIHLTVYGCDFIINLTLCSLSPPLYLSYEPAWQSQLPYPKEKSWTRSMFERFQVGHEPGWNHFQQASEQQLYL